jgi:hypothetical protein
MTPSADCTHCFHDDLGHGRVRHVCSLGCKQMELLSTPTVFGLYSPAMGSGKSEVAKVLVNEFNAKLVKFAGPLKDMTRTLLLHMGVTPSDIERCLEGDMKELPVPGWARQEPVNPLSNYGQQEITPRRIMQTLGTEWRDLIDHNLWVRIAVENAKEQLARGHHVVIDDMRFPHELEAVKALGGKIVVIVRPGAQVTNKHSSEGRLEGYQFDHWIRNESTLADLRWTVRDMMKGYK